MSAYRTENLPQFRFRQQRRRTTAEVDGFQFGAGQVLFLQANFSAESVYEWRFTTQVGTEMKIAVVAGLFAEGNMNVEVHLSG